MRRLQPCRLSPITTHQAKAINRPRDRGKSTEVIDPKGRVRKRYITTSFTFEHLDELAGALSDNDAARQLDEAREQLFQSIHNAQSTAA